MVAKQPLLECGTGGKRRGLDVFFCGNYGGKIVLIASVGNLDIVPSGAVV